MKTPPVPSEMASGASWEPVAAHTGVPSAGQPGAIQPFARTRRA